MTSALIPAPIAGVGRRLSSMFREERTATLLASGIVVIIAIDLILAAMLTLEHARIEG